jgi:uncharacterized protein (DUF2141 family)
MTRTLLVAATFLAAAPVSAASLVVKVDNVRSREGELRVAVCERSFDEAGCRIGARRSAAAGGSEFRFDDLAPGRYAIAAYHDLNGNGELDRLPPGLPTEPYGFSNEVGRFGPPSFEKALVPVGQGETAVVVSLGRLFKPG